MQDVPRLGSGVPLVARSAEMDRLRAALERAREGEAGAVLLSGDAGVGKSRLLNELSALAGSMGAVVLPGRCLDAGESGLPYLPFAEAIAAVPDPAPAVRDRPALAGLVPGLAAPGAAPGEAPTGPADAGVVTRNVMADALPAGIRAPGRLHYEPDISRLRLFDAVHGLLGELAADGCVLVTIEDLHWADGSTRDLLAYLLARLHRQRLLLVATYRSDDLHRRHPLRPLLAELFRLPAVERLDLRPFSPPDARLFATALAGEEMPGTVVQEVATRSEGNAFFAEELVAAYQERSADGGIGSAPARPWLMPSALADVLLSRIERLSPTAQQVARAAAVAGRQVGYPRLLAATGLPEPEVEDALRELVQHNVLLAADRDELYAFRHALLAEAVYADLLAGERIRLHAAYARRLVNEQDRRGRAAELAYHSLRSNDLPQALSASVRAAGEAERSDAPAEALRHLEQALELWDAVPAPLAGDGHLDLLRRARDAAGNAGDPERALAYARSVVRVADEQGTPTQAAQARQDLAARMVAIDGLEREAADIIEDAWRLVRQDEPTPVAAWLLSLRAALQRWLGDLATARESARESVRIARAAGSAAAEADALITLAVLDEGAGQPGEAYRRLLLARDRAAAAGAHGVELRALANLGINRADLGRLAEARTHFTEGIRRSEEAGLALTILGLDLRIHTAISAYASGDWDACLRAAEPPGEGLSPLASAMLGSAGLAARVARGEFEAVAPLITRLRSERHPDLLVALQTAAAGAELESWLGRPEAALDHVQDTLHRFEEQFGEPWMLAGIRLAALGVSACADLAEQARRRRDHAGEEAAANRGHALVEHARLTTVHGTPRSGDLGPEGRAWLARAEAEATRLAGAGDPERWQEVVAAFDYGHRYEQANARHRLAAALLATGRRDDAAAEMRAAAATASELGAAPLAGAVRQLADRARIALADPAGAPANGASRRPGAVLTPRELAVLEQVALGRTNRQAGEQLYISEKTVSVHLSRVMAKLGASSRAEAVAAGYDRGLLAARSENP